MIHTTGAGPWNRYKHGGYSSPYSAATHIYQHVMKYSPHFLVCGETGKVTQINELDQIAMHTGSKSAWRYRFDNWPGRKDLAWWFKRFPGCASPRDLLDKRLWRQGSANALTIGIEIAPPMLAPRAPWKPETWKSLHSLTHWLAPLFGFPCDRYHVLTHSDANPLQRITKKGQPWDASATQWQPDYAATQLGFA